MGRRRPGPGADRVGGDAVSLTQEWRVAHCRLNCPHYARHMSQEGCQYARTQAPDDLRRSVKIPLLDEMLDCPIKADRLRKAGAL